MKLHEFFRPLTLEDGHHPAPFAWRQAAASAREKGDRLAMTVTGDIGGVAIATCVGPISDDFRTARYGPPSEFPLPDAGATDRDFEDFLAIARGMTDTEFAASLA